MTNGELYQDLEKISEQAVVLVRDCKGDKTKIDDELWNELVRQFQQVEEYV